MEIFTIGFTRTTAEDFFERLKAKHIERLLDVRLNNRSQLAGFAKRDDLAYFLRELIGASYEHMPILAPTPEILDAYKKRRRVESLLDPEGFSRRTVLLCSEDTPEHCHRRLVAEYLRVPGAMWK